MVPEFVDVHPVMDADGYVSARIGQRRVECVEERKFQSGREVTDQGFRSGDGCFRRECNQVPRVVWAIGYRQSGNVCWIIQ